jgi:spermidine dehydrogenase
MDREISRRDFINGVAVAAGALALPAWAEGGQQPVAPFAPEQAADYYPPTRTGMRGSHDGSFEAAHALRDRRPIDLASVAHTGETYDLVVVGGGLSGLAAAHFFVKRVGRNARVLVLDNHDDFGGHAKRNEFHYNGKMLALNGGTLNIESPLRYDKWSAQLLQDIGIDLPRYTSRNKHNDELYRSKGLRSGYFFDKETWGVDRLVLPDPSPQGGGRRARFAPEYLAKMPLSARAKDDLLRITAETQPDYMPGLSSDEKKARLARMSYESYLRDVAKVDDQVQWFYMGMGRGNFCVGSDAVPALFAWEMGGGGFSGLKLEPTPDGLLADLPGGQHGRQRSAGGGGSIHLPDGNATVARLLVRWLIPDALPGTTQEDSGTAKLDYAKLDRPNQAARIRLNSTVVNVKHDGDAERAREVIVTYNRGGKLYDVRARATVMACWNMFIPYLAPELPAAQQEALAYGVKGPLVYTSVAITNWRSFEKLGLESVNCPTMYHDSMGLTEAADLGDLHHARTPDEPIAIHMGRHPCAPGKPRKEQHRIGRAELLATPFQTFERSIRDQLGRVLGPGGFDPARDIVAITVNRWPHGYAYTYNSLSDPVEWVFTLSDDRPCVKARKPYGLITIANSDAAASPHTDAAMLEAHRAVSEVLERRAYPFLPRTT